MNFGYITKQHSYPMHIKHHFEQDTKMELESINDITSQLSPLVQ